MTAGKTNLTPPKKKPQYKETNFDLINNYRHSDNKCNLVIIIDLIFYSFCPDLIVFARLKSLSLVQQVNLGTDKKLT